MFWNKKLELIKPDYCFGCGKFSLVKLNNKEAVFSCGSKLNLIKGQKYKEVLDAMTLSKFCVDTVYKSVDEGSYLVEREKEKLNS